MLTLTKILYGLFIFKQNKKSPLSTINHSSSLVDLVDRGDLFKFKLIIR
nr:MAG TPA: hypothetical protein [Caudoviricetes sp.]